MKNKIFGMLALSVIAIVLLLAGCNKSKPAQTGNDDDAGKETKKDELIMAFGSEPETGFDPTTGWGRYGSPLFQSTLLKRDDNLNIVNDLATSYEVDEKDGKTWTVQLREY